jgi:phosphoribosylaminoimidazole-succinocarboxamide synthase
MISHGAIMNQTKFTLKETDFKNLGKKYQGKVRDIYVFKDKIFLISTDRQSAFDRNLAIIPFKGQVLTQTSVFWFDKTEDIIPNHIIAVPDPNVIVGKNLNVFPVEVVVRGYITGVTGTSAWTSYRKGERNFCGSVLPEGLQKNQKFNKPIITPTTKSEEHDEQISPEEIVKRKLMTQEQWNYIAEKALELFKRGSRLADKNSLILVDAKYEFGYDDHGKIYCSLLNTPTIRSRDGVLPASHLLFSKMQGNEVESVNTPTVRSWEVYLQRRAHHRERFREFQAAPDSVRNFLQKHGEFAGARHGRQPRGGRTRDGTFAKTGHRN